MRSTLVILVLIGALLSHGVATRVIGEGSENPKLDSAYMEVTPEIQGVGGTLTLLTSVQVNGTC